ncbi:IS3 family transposase [Xanthocytophaga flava]|uniref:IS3 family transposase n=1 Tax=Xanthocytophaga flava TaxID=3048013 RepID=UPI0036F31AC7
MSSTRKLYDRAFKVMAVELCLNGQASQQVADDLGIRVQMLNRWKKEYLQNKENSFSGQGNLSAEQAEIYRLKKLLRQAEMERDNLKKGSQHLFQRKWQLFQFINKHCSEFAIEKMCTLLGVSRSGYYRWVKQWSTHTVCKRKQANEHLLEQIKRVHKESKSCYGSPRISTQLKKEGFSCSRPRVARLMKQAQLKGLPAKGFKVCTTDSDHTYPRAANLLNRQFTVEKLNQVWVSDLTYIRTKEGWLYLTIILDLADRKVVGWSVSESLQTESTLITAWRMAITQQSIKTDHSLIFHSDQGVQYACDLFQSELSAFPHIQQSMSRKGNCWDNAVAESFFKTLKTEWIYRLGLQSKAQTRREIFTFIEIWYNRKRIHTALGNLTPSEKEEQLCQSQQEEKQQEKHLSTAA